MPAVASDSHMFAVSSPQAVHWAVGLPAGASALDVAYGSRRHMRWLATHGLRLAGIDHDAAALSGLADIVETIVADTKGGPWLLPVDATFDAVVAANYLHRPLWPHLLTAVALGSRLIYEIFADGNETVGKLLNSVFLLTPGELLDAVQGPMWTIGYEDGFLTLPQDVYLQRICTVREPSGAVAPRYAL